jgi:hypothetical protein
MKARSPPLRSQLCPLGILLLAFISLLSCLLVPSEAKVYSRCEMARVLKEFGLDGYRGYGLADCKNRTPLSLSLWPPAPSCLHSLPLSLIPSPLRVLGVFELSYHL